MNLLQTVLHDKLLRIGWGLLLLSAVVFCAPSLFNASPESNVPFFVFHFAVAVVHFFIIRLNGRERIDEHSAGYRFTGLILFLISAYALNREMDVFSASPLWFTLVLVVLSANYLATAFFGAMPEWCRHFSAALLGVAMIVFGYLSVYLMPLYAVSVFALLALAISVHTFVPFLFVVFTVFLANRLAQNRRRYWLSFTTGMLLAVACCIVFSVMWSGRLRTINRHYTAAMADGEDRLPLWTQIAQRIEQDAITEAILKTDLIYTIPNWERDLFWRMPTRNFGEQQQLHDPLVVIASALTGPVLLAEDDRIKILESQYGARHQALERLWSGEDLKTEQVTTGIKIWPGWHLAYTEKLITVHNGKDKQRWQREEEGIYTFHLPEGGVVTSLSLWIAGKEAKGILTSKQAAATAYNIIVGKERRDPSVVHWQEGNTVSVRVFPVMAGESRTFKIGVTAPLLKDCANLVYDNIWFEGPDAGGADETVKIEVTQPTDKPVAFDGFETVDGKTFTREGRYNPRWTVRFTDGGISANQFSFGGHQYSIKPYQPKRTATVITDVFLDINRSWSADECKAVFERTKGRKVWVHDGEFKALTDANKQALFAHLQKQNFSLFPFHLVGARDRSLVVTKSGGYTPNIADIEGTSFRQNLQSDLNDSSRVALFHLGTDLSPYVRSLQELRCFRFECGDAGLLSELLSKNEFVQDEENDNRVVIHSAGAAITKEVGDAASTAPDHLMRLFAYNHVMQQLSRSDSASKDNAAIVKEAEEAYVVTPVSSLVVLETQTDYDRFGIKDSEKSLRNASLKNKGAVPEPAEWAVILLFGGAFLFFFYKRWGIA